VLSANAYAASPAASGKASASSSTSAEANRSGASASQGNNASASAAGKHADANADGSSEMSATLSRPVDARKAKPGDAVTATNDRDVRMADGTTVKQGSKLVGHVTKARPLSKPTAGKASGESQSMMSIVFDKAILKDGHEVPLNATIQAVSAVESDASMASELGGVGTSMAGSGAGSARAAGGGLLGGVGGAVSGGVNAAGGVAGGASQGVNSTVGGATSVASHSAGAVGGLNAGGALTSGSKGVFGMQGLDIAAAAANSAEGSVISSPTRNVRLDEGTKLLLIGSAATSAK
jgi:hypothetical protein